MIALRKGDVILAGEYGVPVWWLDDSDEPEGYEAQKYDAHGAWVVTGKHGDDYAVQQGGNSFLALTHHDVLADADITVTRKGKQMWPVPEPSIDKDVEENIYRTLKDNQGVGAIAFGLMEEFDITRKEK